MSLDVPAVPLSEYLNTSYRPDCDDLEGRLLERNVGEWDHSRLQALPAHHLMGREKQLAILVATEQRVQVKANRFRVPDITVVSGAMPPGQILTEPPFLCIEILSAGDRLAEMQDRIDDYLNFGVRYVWLIDSRNRRAFVYTTHGVEEARNGILETQDPHILVNLSEIE